MRGHRTRLLPRAKGYAIIIDVGCQNFANEIQQYHWEEDKDGNAIQRPVKKMDHLIDALRYAVEPLMTRGKTGAGIRL